MSPTVDKASCNENRGDSLLNLQTQAGGCSCPAARLGHCSADAPLQGSEERPGACRPGEEHQNHASKCAHRKEKWVPSLQRKCWNSMPSYTISISSLFQLYYNSEKVWPLKKKNPAATMGIITHLNVRISFMQRTRKTKILRNTFKITREK